MDKCKDCGIDSPWKCVTCSVFLCVVHKVSHNADDQEHHFIRCKLRVSEMLKENTLKSIASKMKLLDEYSNTITQTTKLILTELTTMSKAMLSNIKQHRIRYNNILQQLNAGVTEEQLKVIEKESAIVSLHENQSLPKCHLEKLWFRLEILKEFVIDPNPHSNEEFFQSVSKVIIDVYQNLISSIGTPCMKSETLKVENGVYYGEIEKGLAKGRGVGIYDNGDIYDGYWENNLSEGEGFVIYGNGDMYYGEKKGGKNEGTGAFKNNSGEFKGCIYSGQWKNQMMEGRGMLKSQNGDLYDGEWKNGNREGRGVYTLADGTVYHDGLWKSGKIIKHL